MQLERYSWHVGPDHKRVMFDNIKKRYLTAIEFDQLCFENIKHDSILENTYRELGIKHSENT